MVLVRVLLAVGVRNRVFCMGDGVGSGMRGSAPSYHRAPSLAIAVLAVTLQSVSLSAQAPTFRADLSWFPCPTRFAESPARCGALKVAEDIETPASRRIPLHFALLRPTKPHRDRVLTVLINGGPGYGGLIWYRGNAQLFGLPDTTSDVLVIDQRGTGASGRITCGEMRGPWWMLPGDALRACHDSLATIADLSKYTHHENSNDLDLLRKALGYQYVALFGVSYGARVALVYAADHPESVTRLVLHSPAPMEPWPSVSASALARLASLGESDCAQMTCRGVPSEAQRQAAAAIEAMSAKPRTVVYRASSVVAPESLWVTRRTTALILRDLYLDPADSVDLVAFRTDLAKGTTDAISDWYRRQKWSASEFSIGPFMSETCRYDNPQLPGNGPQQSWLSAIVEAVRDGCAAWPSGHATELRMNGRVTAPTLVVLGDRDLIQPPEAAASYANLVERLDVLIVRGMGHSDVSACAQSFVRNWHPTSGRGRRDFSCVDTR